MPRMLTPVAGNPAPTLSEARKRGKAVNPNHYSCFSHNGLYQSAGTARPCLEDWLRFRGPRRKYGSSPNIQDSCDPAESLLAEQYCGIDGQRAPRNARDVPARDRHARVESRGACHRRLGQPLYRPVRHRMGDHECVPRAFQCQPGDSSASRAGRAPLSPVFAESASLY